MAFPRIYGSGNAPAAALNGIDIDFPASGFAAIMGPSGSGTSTLMHCVAGLDIPCPGPSYSRRHRQHGVG